MWLQYMYNVQAEMTEHTHAAMLKPWRRTYICERWWCVDAIMWSVFPHIGRFMCVWFFVWSAAVIHWLVSLIQRSLFMEPSTPSQRNSAPLNRVRVETTACLYTYLSNWSHHGIAISRSCQYNVTHKCCSQRLTQLLFHVCSTCEAINEPIMQSAFLDDE
jgi:hypothetical protein